jgi:hypothetical protein
MASALVLGDLVRLKTAFAAVIFDRPAEGNIAHRPWRPGVTIKGSRFAPNLHLASFMDALHHAMKDIVLLTWKRQFDDGDNSPPMRRPREVPTDFLPAATPCSLQCLSTIYISITPNASNRACGISSARQQQFHTTKCEILLHALIIPCVHGC